eukprot:gene7881-17733_t
MGRDEKTTLAGKKSTQGSKWKTWAENQFYQEQLQSAEAKAEMLHRRGVNPTYTRDADAI